MASRKQKTGDGKPDVTGPDPERKAPRRWLAPWRESTQTSAIYHVISRVVNHQVALDPDEKEHFRILLRMQERFTGCHILAYCLMGNHFHLLLEVPPPPDAGLAADSLDRELFAKRLEGLYEPAKVADILSAMDEALAATDGPDAARIEAVKRTVGPYLERMYDLSHFMKGVLQRYTRWYNSRHDRKGTMWEERFKSVIVESGVSARTLAAYIDLNPVRAGLVEDPSEYRWSSYGEAVAAGGRKTGGKAARVGLVRVLLSAEDAEADPSRWGEVSAKYRALLNHAIDCRDGNASARQRRGKNPDAEDAEAGAGADDGFAVEMGFAGILMRTQRHFSDGAVIGGKDFVERYFEQARECFGPRRKSGARRLRGPAAEAADVIWTVRDLQAGM